MDARIIRMIISAVLFAVGIILNMPLWYVEAAIFLISFAVIGYDVVYKAVRNLFCGQVLDENLLMTVASIGAFVIRSYSEAVAVMLLYQIGEYFTDRAVQKSRRSIASLMDIRPDTACVLRDGSLKKVHPEQVLIGEIIAVRPGDRIPLDGIVTEGQSAIDTSALTGESVPRYVHRGEEVLSGCVNMSGLLNIKVTSLYHDSTVSRILELTENALDKKARSEKFISKFAAVYTPIVVGLAVVLAVAFPLILRQEFSVWIYRALSFLVVSCPCALVISVPLSFFAAIGKGSRKGILLKGSGAVEALEKTAIVALDKTGTLTKGMFCVTKTVPAGISEEELLNLAASAESFSTHPIALSLKRAAKNCVKAEDAKEIPGKGIEARVGQNTVTVGNFRLMQQNNISCTEINEGEGAVYVALDNVFKGYIVISDVVKSDALKLVGELKKLGIKKTVMLTGDTKSSAQKVKEETGIDEAVSGLLPIDKVRELEKLLLQKGEKECVVYAGDGINDAPVLARADAGIAMGGVGSDAAIEAADAVIMTDEPLKIAEAIALSKKTMRIVRQNIIFALGVKAAALVLSALGITGMWLAVFADVGVAMLAVLNALRAGSGK
ncbi:MAG: cadmium-translocating P-type ATPase [Christensenellaceae bacterium]|nr:cadmium-translocating P-type ATPase [Christensenellaceae bacterium]